MAEEDNFNWWTDESVVIKPKHTHGVAVFTNDENDIVIKRELDEHLGEREAPFIVIPRSEVKRFLKAVDRVYVDTKPGRGQT